MKLERFDDVDRFEARVWGFLVEREAVHNLMFGIVGYVRAGLVRDPLLATVEREGELQLVALRTPPYPLVLSLPATEAALEPLVEALAGGGLTGVNGPVEAAAAFAKRWTAATGQQARTYMSQRIYQLERVVPVQEVPGLARDAREADRAVVAPWSSAFVEEAVPGDPHDPDAWFDRYLGHLPRTLLLWEVGGEPVSMAATGGSTPNGDRISWVYTPPALRGNGYASAVVAALSRKILDAGRRFCFLFTDQANPVSNRIYARIGYRPVIDTRIYHFEPPTRA